MLLSTMSIGDALITGVAGYGVVFLGLTILMVVILVMGKVMTRSKQSAAPAQVAVPAQAAAAPAAKPAPGTAGEVKLYDVSDRDAAMIMAIVAEKMGRPLNELRFKSIKEVQ